MSAPYQSFMSPAVDEMWFLFAVCQQHYTNPVPTKSGSLEELATASGVSRSMLSEIEREKANPTLTVTFRIARAFGLTLQELIESA
ncbi:MAG: helix-turn-helix domain-containing protein [Prosthecobacter sp.]